MTQTKPEDNLRECCTVTLGPNSLLGWLSFTIIEQQIWEKSNSRGMAASSAARGKPSQKSDSPLKIFRDPKVVFAFALIFIDALLVFLIITFVPCKINLSPLSVYVLCIVWLLFWLLHFQTQRSIGMLTCHRWDHFFGKPYELISISARFGCWDTREKRNESKIENSASLN